VRIAAGVTACSAARSSWTRRVGSGVNPNIAPTKEARRNAPQTGRPPLSSEALDGARSVDALSMQQLWQPRNVDGAVRFIEIDLGSEHC
jgi:hypothetical protein